MIKAQIVTIGDEILIGQIVDSNSAWLASELTKMGFVVSSIYSISDNKEQITDTINEGFKTNKLLILTGGLGPTKDDITKNTLCNYFKTELKHNTDVYNDVIRFLEERGAKMNELNRDQALFPEGAKLLRNKQGTAPGMWFEQNDKILISLPGVPWEMKGIFSSEASSKLKEYFELPYNYYQTVMISGIGESPLALKLSSWENQLPKNLKLAYLPSPGLIRLRLGILGLEKEGAQNIVAEEIKKLYHIIPNYIISEHEVLLQEIVINLLKNKHKTIATAESCTGGTIAQLLTSISGSSTVFKGSVVAYSNEVKQQVLDVSAADINLYGAVSQQVVEQMAAGARKLLKTDIAIATSGIAGPDGGTAEKPVGTVWIAVSDAHKTVSKSFLFGNDRSLNIQRSANAALNILRLFILNNSTI